VTTAVAVAPVPETVIVTVAACVAGTGVGNGDAGDCAVQPDRGFGLGLGATGLVGAEIVTTASGTVNGLFAQFGLGPK
jgi:hypothetical protein